MGACTYKAITNKENRKTKLGLYSLYIRVTLDRRSIYIKLDQKIDEQFWLGKEGKWIRDAHPLAFDLNALIRSKILALQEFELKQRIQNNSVTLEKIKKSFSTKGDMTNVHSYFKNWIANLKGFAPGTIKAHRVVLMNCHRWNSDLKFGQVKESTLQEFADWMANERKFRSQTINKALRTFTRVIKEAVKDGYLQQNPFANTRVKVRQSESQRIYLNEQEIKKLKLATIPSDREDLLRTRDHWLFCFYSCFYYSDLKKLKWSDLKEDPDYGIYIQGNRFKNGQAYIAPIYKFKNALSILERQRGNDQTFVFTETISSQKFNDKLKDICEIAGIDKELNNRAARHSGIQFYIAHGLEISHVAKLVGHRKTATTSGYFELTATDVNERVAKIDFKDIDV
jgi:site-specific recombinase XerD